MLQIEQSEDFFEKITRLVLKDINSLLYFGSIVQLKAILSLSEDAKKLDADIREKLSRCKSIILRLQSKDNFFTLRFNKKRRNFYYRKSRKSIDKKRQGEKLLMRFKRCYFYIEKRIYLQEQREWFKSNK